MSSMIRPVILCGGAGTRLWPLSRQHFPKQLLPLTGEQSLLQQTALRLGGDQFAPAIIVGGHDQRVFIKRQLEQAGAAIETIILEPAARGTSAAAALAAAWLTPANRDELLMLVPSDHVILNRKALLRAIGAGTPHAEAGAIVTFGAQPTEPNTQFGYIEAKIDNKPSGRVLPIARFVEKPDAQKAAEYLATGRFYWNTGIFLLKASTLLEEMRRFLPDSLDAITTSVTNASTDGIFVRPQAEAFKSAANISIDHGIMEKTSRGMVVPVQMDWSDVGSWDAVWKLGSKDANQNVTQGDVVALDTHASLLRSDKGAPLIATVGINHLAVIAVADAVFVSPLDRVSEVKQLVDRLKTDAHESVVSPPRRTRPWGSDESIARRPSFQVKHIMVDPGERLSFQAHDRGSAHWVLARGSAEVTVGERISTLRENESIFIPTGTDHALMNSGSVPVELVEILCRRDREHDVPRLADK